MPPSGWASGRQLMTLGDRLMDLDKIVKAARDQGWEVGAR
jgi:hypothetical protein